MAQRRRRLGEIIRAMRTEAGLEQAQLADRVNEITGHVEGKGRLTQPRISDLERNGEALERDLANLAAIDVACGFDPGHALELAGYLRRHDGVDLEAAILASSLDPMDQQTMLILLRGLRARPRAD